MFDFAVTYGSHCDFFTLQSISLWWISQLPKVTVKSSQYNHYVLGWLRSHLRAIAKIVQPLLVIAKLRRMLKLERKSKAVSGEIYLMIIKGRSAQRHDSFTFDSFNIRKGSREGDEAKKREEQH